MACATDMPRGLVYFFQWVAVIPGDLKAMANWEFLNHSRRSHRLYKRHGRMDRTGSPALALEYLQLTTVVNVEAPVPYVRIKPRG